MRMGDQDGLQFIANSSALPNELTNPHTLFWQVAVGRKGSGGVAIVGYFVRWDTTDNVNPTARLCRAFVEELDAPATANPLFKVYETPANWLDGAFVNEAAPADAVNYYRGFLAENIVGIWFRFFDSAGDPIGIPSDMMDSRIGYTETGSGANRQVPFSVEVSIAITDRQAATQITSVSEITSQYGKLYESGSLNPRSFLDALPKPIAAGTYVYTVRVEIPIAR